MTKDAKAKESDDEEKQCAVSTKDDAYSGRRMHGRPLVGRWTDGGRRLQDRRQTAC